MYFFSVGEELKVWKVCDIPAAVASSLEIGTEELIQVPHQVAFSGLKSSILEHVNEPVWESKDLSLSHGGAAGPGPVDEGPGDEEDGEESSSPPIMSMAAELEEQHVIKPSRPIMATWDIFYIMC
jgi:hypothetical protein